MISKEELLTFAKAKADAWKAWNPYQGCDAEAMLEADLNYKRYMAADEAYRKALRRYDFLGESIEKYEDVYKHLSKGVPE